MNRSAFELKLLSRKVVHDSQRSDSEFPICQLYGHVKEFSPAREVEVIVIQQVKDIHGREGWDSLAWHVFTTMSITPDRRSSGIILY